MFTRNFFVLPLQLPVAEPQRLLSVLGASPSECVCQYCSDFSTPYHQKTPICQSQAKHIIILQAHLGAKSRNHVKYGPVGWTIFPGSHCVHVSVCHLVFHLPPAFNQNVVTATQRQGGNAYLTTGFCHWKKAVQRFREHELSDMHREAAVKSMMMSTTSNVAEQVTSTLPI